MQDGSEYAGHSQLNYEQHNIWVNEERAQVFNVLYHRTWFLGDETEVLPHSICAKVRYRYKYFLHNDNTGIDNRAPQW